MIRIGINPLTWTNDDMPELGAQTPLEVCLAEGKQAGYAGFELGNKFPRTLAPLKAIMARFELALVSGWYSSRLLERSVEQEIDALQDHLALLKGMGCQVMVFAECTGCIHGDRSRPLSQRPRLQPNEWPEFAARLSQVADYLQQQGIRMAYHHHMGTVVETAHDIDALMTHCTDAVGLLLDTGHLTYAGGDPLSVLQTYAQRVVHVHCKDVRAAVLAEVRAADDSFLNAVLKGVFTVPGDGAIDYAPLINTLQQQRYAGWLVVEAEQDPAKAHPLTYARNGYRHLNELVNRKVS